MITLKSKLSSISGFSDHEKDFLLKALELQELINNSLEFKTLWLAQRPSHNKDMRQSEIYEMLMSGISRFNKSIDYQLDFALWKYKKKKGTYASTNMRTGNIVLNSIHFTYLMNKKFGYIYLSSSLMHEAMHSFYGFEDLWPNKRSSVPYTMGNVHRKLGENYLIKKIPLTKINKIEG